MQWDEAVPGTVEESLIADDVGVSEESAELSPAAVADRKENVFFTAASIADVLVLIPVAKIWTGRRGDSSLFPLEFFRKAGKGTGIRPLVAQQPFPCQYCVFLILIEKTV